MKYEVIDVYCIACQEKILTPADCVPESFRFGIPIHIRCSQIIDRFLRIWKSVMGGEYGGNLSQEPN